MGVPVGDLEKSKLAPLTDAEYDYYKQMTIDEKRFANFGKRTNPDFPQKLRYYMSQYPQTKLTSSQQEKSRRRERYHINLIKDFMAAEAQRRLENHNIWVCD